MRMFRAARSRWTYPMSERYLIPAAMPRSIPTSWMTVNWPSCFCSGDAAQRHVRRLTAARAAAFVGMDDPVRPPEVVLTLRKASNEPFSMYSMTIITGLPANITDHTCGHVQPGAPAKELPRFRVFSSYSQLLLLLDFNVTIFSSITAPTWKNVRRDYY